MASLKMGLDGRQIFSDCGIDPDTLGQPLQRIPVSKMQHVWQIVENSVDDKNHLASTIESYLNASSFHALGFGLYSSDSLEALFLRLCRYSGIISSSVNMQVNQTRSEFHYTIADLRSVRSHLTSAVMTLFLLRICRELGGHESAPIYIEVPWTENEYADALRAYSAVPLRFEQLHHRLVYDLKTVKKPIPNSTSALSIYQDNLCRDYLYSLDEHRHLPSRVRSKIMQGLSNNRADIETIAMTLHMSTRTLQRKLDDENSSFREILLSVRKEQASEFLKNPDISATQIAYNLGFSALTPFSSSFKLWFGQTFTEYRREQMPHLTDSHKQA
ncbi:MAG: AraC family transcriptional regulator ligand-binding domain-containing protein [Candidatus Azotimanducaceae bacterium WSBS_2022_MAG_OTU7]